jgi:hypothetical protein
MAMPKPSLRVATTEEIRPLPRPETERTSPSTAILPAKTRVPSGARAYS